MTITFDAKAKGIQGYGGSISHTHIVGAGANRILLAFVSMKSGSTPADELNFVKFNGVNMTSLQRYVGAGTCLYAYYMLNPPSGSFPVDTQFSSSSSASVCETVSFSNVDQAAAFIDSVKQGSNFSGPVQSITVGTAAGAVAVDAIAFADPPPTSLTVDASQTELDNWGNGGGKLQGTSILATSYKAGGTSMTWNTQNGQPYAQIAVSLKSDAAAGPPPDTTPPTMTGTVTANSITQTGANVDWSATARADNVAITGYETSLDGGGYVDRGMNLSAAFSGFSAATAHTVDVRDYDAAGNRSTPALRVSFTTASAAAASATVTSPPLQLNNGTLRASEAGFNVFVHNVATGALLATATGVATDAAGKIAVSSNNLAAGTTYRMAFIKGTDVGTCLVAAA